MFPVVMQGMYYKNKELAEFIQFYFSSATERTSNERSTINTILLSITQWIVLLESYMRRSEQFYFIMYESFIGAL